MIMKGLDLNLDLDMHLHEVRYKYKNKFAYQIKINDFMMTVKPSSSLYFDICVL